MIYIGSLGFDMVNDRDSNFKDPKICKSRTFYTRTLYTQW